MNVNPIIKCNNNNDDQNDQQLITNINYVNENSEVPTIKYLGVFFDNKLSFKHQIDKVKSKLSKALYSLRLAKNVLDPKSQLNLYYSLFHSHLIYALPIWSCSTPGYLNDVFKIQKKAVRIITNSHYNDHTEPIFKNLKILPFPDLCTYFKIQFMQRFVNDFTPISFKDTWYLNNIREIGENFIQLRNAQQFYIPFSRLAIVDRLPLLSYPKEWENFPDEQIKITRNITKFDLELKEYYLNDLQAIPTCNRLFCPACTRLGTN